VPRFEELVAPSHWRTVDFISDLHLQASEPATVAAWQHYLQTTPADALFILGDLFEVWVGDDALDDPGSFEAQACALLQAASRQRMRCTSCTATATFSWRAPLSPGSTAASPACTTPPCWSLARPALPLLSHGDAAVRGRCGLPALSRAGAQRRVAARVFVASRSQSAAHRRAAIRARERSAQAVRLRPYADVDSPVRHRLAAGRWRTHSNPRPHPPPGQTMRWHPACSAWCSATGTRPPITAARLETLRLSADGLGTRGAEPNVAGDLNSGACPRQAPIQPTMPPSLNRLCAAVCVPPWPPCPTFRQSYGCKPCSAIPSWPACRCPSRASCGRSAPCSLDHKAVPRRPWAGSDRCHGHRHCSAGLPAPAAPGRCLPRPWTGTTIS
jgi:UDP-2,3-diacylglucosamine hydrolase